jgi:hypothetical protein
VQSIHTEVDRWARQLSLWASTGGHDLQRDLARLNKMAGSWAARAAVKMDEPENQASYDSRLPDFLPELLPFHEHPDFRHAPEPYRQAALSCGWLAYSEKTVAIESRIVSPACMHLVDSDVAGLCGERFREPVAQALVDESYHILLVVRACGLTRRLRGLADLHLPQFELVTNMRRCQDAYAERWKKILIQLATAVVSELLVSDYLRLLAQAPDIQPLNRITTEIHRRDEAAHNGLFKSLGAVIYHALNAYEKEFFVRALTLPAAWFASPEWEVWHAMLGQIGFPNADRMLRDCQANQQSRRAGLDLTTLEVLFADLGVEGREPIGLPAPPVAPPALLVPQPSSNGE